MEGSEIARLRAHIDQQAQAAKAGMSGLAQGVAQHRIIVSKMERLTHELISTHGYEHGMQLMMHRLEQEEV